MFADRLCNPFQALEGGFSSAPQDLCLPSLDDLLADSNVPESDGLFSGFQTLSNKDLDMFVAPEQDVSQSHQQSNNLSGTTCDGRSHSDGSDGEMSQVNTRASTFQISQTHAAPPQAQSRQAPGRLTADVPGANTGSTFNAAPPSSEQQASLSLAGMTAAEVALALGLDAAQQPHAQQPHAQHGKKSANPLPAQPPVRKQANGRKKRGRDIEAAVTSSGASEQHATSTVVADLTTRAGSPGVSSSTAVPPAQIEQEPGSSANTAADEEEQKRMVC